MPKRITYPDTDAFPSPHQQGLTKREYFAVQILAGMLTNSDFVEMGSLVTAEEAVLRADALIKELNE